MVVKSMRKESTIKILRNCNMYEKNKTKFGLYRLGRHKIEI